MTGDIPQAPNSAAETVESAITGRKSIRAFLPTPVPQPLVERILEVAARAPSGTNMQPWRVYAVAGAKKDELSRALVSAFLEGRDASKSEYRYYPDEFFEPYLSRRRKVGWDLYDLLGIKKGETVRMLKQHARNFEFFGAPVGLLFTIDRRLEIGSWLDYGMFLENIMIAARGHGLDTCPQAAFAYLHDVIRQHLPIPDNEIVICGMSLGYADPNAVVNTLVTDREPASRFVTFVDFEV